MARIEPLDRDDVPELDEYFRSFEDRMGFLPNSLLTMARYPDLVRAFAALGRVVYRPTENIPVSLKNMIANVASRTVGCDYCVAHTASNATRSDIAAAKLDALCRYDTSPLFSDKERAVLRFAEAAASVPNTVEDSHFDDLRQYFGDDEIVEILGVVAYFGYLNRWNDTMATSLEPIPLAIGERHMAAGGWTVGKHGAD